MVLLYLVSEESSPASVESRSASPSTPASNLQVELKIDNLKLEHEKMGTKRYRIEVHARQKMVRIDSSGKRDRFVRFFRNLLACLSFQSV